MKDDIKVPKTFNNINNSEEISKIDLLKEIDKLKQQLKVKNNEIKELNLRCDVLQKERKKNKK